ncbi:5-oxoprolinase subunit PxpA [Membranihabitans marinus]|uniref:5-oxoprolinase subunit PxpA n=1 Tax=Membranihabitans marinus TaxID=1227546 RepID=UPI001F1C1324|nr:5-oxoprolinase subunit PxpA [Membranihabitans marinus]
MLQRKIDINCDLGESYGHFKVGDDVEMMSLISSCNIACGFHGGDPLTIERSIALAAQHEVQIGAHISYPDLMGFGRRSMKIPPLELKAIIKYQLSALYGMAWIQGIPIQHVKLHGALYNDANLSEEIAQTVVQTLIDWPLELALYCPAHSLLYNIAQNHHIEVMAEAFIDRKYLANGQLKPRNQIGSVIHSLSEALEQLEEIVIKNKVKVDDGSYIPLQAQTICLHGDHSDAIKLAKAVKNRLSELNITMESPLHYD